MSFLWAVIAGLVIGVLARIVLPGRQPIPIWLTILLGIVGALGGNALAGALGVRDTGGVDWIRHLLQIGVAALVIAVVSPVWGRRT
ncbi:GlsB/YeaQ/YmgE family stress response membrane protein [Kitasatospora sp. NPDC057015]|uniref:GlsB/YeaQ/YmgE family stress response membrane protein n=1 Tax=Kitasatospora sp. NPDC057015 TaxID=3346001 RepID=UPI00362A0646